MLDISNFPGLQRRPDTQEIDIKGSIHSFAQGVLSLKAEENRIRGMRKYKAAVLKCFESGSGFGPDNGVYPGEQWFHLEPLVYAAVEKLRHKKEDNVRLWEEMKRHIELNHKRYLKVNHLRIYSATDICHVRLNKP